jgi:hypothetical protein
MSDKRSVSTDALETLGTIIEDGGKDAIHLAVLPVTAGEALKPGQDISFNEGIAYTSKGKMVGIVDPFLKKKVKPGEKFWLIVYPRQITSLRHVWEHPDFPASINTELNPEEKKAETEQWIREFVRDNDSPSYEELIQAYLDGHADTENFYFSGIDAHGEIPNEFWDNMEIVLGKKIKHRPEYFSCSC